MVKKKPIDEPEEIKISNQEQANGETQSNVARVNIRVPKAYKEEWEAFAKKHKFPSFTQFIIFAVNEVVERGIKREVVQEQMGMGGMDYVFVKDMMQQNQIQQEKYMKKMDELVGVLSNLPSIKKMPELKKWIRKDIMRMSNTSEALAEFYEVEEAEVLTILHELVDKGEVRLNNEEMKYEGVKDGNN